MNIVQHSIEILIEVTKLLEVPKSIEDLALFFLQVPALEDIPSACCVIKFRRGIRVIALHLASYHLRKNNNWKQIFFDETSRRKTS